MQDDFQIDNTLVEPEKMKSIIERRLVHVGPDIKAVFPPVLRQNRIRSAVILQPKYAMIVFLAEEEEKRCRERILKQSEPFPGLITTGPEKAACRIEKAVCASARSCTITDSFGFSLGPDSTLFLEDHHQLFMTSDMDVISYTVPLAYIASYGNDIDYTTVYKYFDSLVAYSINMWREGARMKTLNVKMNDCVSRSRLQGIKN